LLKIASGSAVIGLVAFGLATFPLAGIDSAPISAGAAVGFPSAVTPGPSAITTSAEAQEAAMLERAFSAQPMALLGVRVLDLNARGADTMVNVQLSADAVDSTILQPNDVFSFNEIVGVRTIERGYQAGLMYAGGQLVNGVGGGICITATAVYNVALETGMRIVERHPHSGPVAYAEPGRDSAVAYGALDLRFINDTGSTLLVRSIIDEGKLVVAFYGRKQPGREVEIATEDFEPIPYEIVQRADATVPDGESRVDQKGQPGYSVTTVRIVKQNGRVISRQMISRDLVRPRNEIVLVHSGAQLPPEQMSGLIPMPYSESYDMPDVTLSLPDPTRQSGVEGAVPLPDEGTQGSESAEGSP
jgi:hypothetical protein